MGLTTRRLYSGDFPLVDVTVIPDDEIMTHRSMATLADLLVTLLMADTLSSLMVMILIQYLVQAEESADYANWHSGCRNEGKLEFARSLLKMVMPHKSVPEATGLTADELAQICY